ncbi:MAG: type IV secretion system protein, partial [Rhodospirillaceae bacterium]|nr:type IV secretion system protein [Rhodospirillaceae bacterium]
MFDSTKPLFQKWLLYGIGTMFSLAVLSFTVSVALDVVIAVAASFWVGSFLGASPEGISSTALQQGGVGMILTMLIITAPPIAGNFFQATLANFSSYNQFAGSQSPPGKPNVNAYNSNSYNQQQQRNDQRQEQVAPTTAPTNYGVQTPPQPTGLR